MGYQNYSDTHSGSVGVNHLYVVHCLNLILIGSTLKLKEVLHQLRLGKTEVERSDIGQRDAVEIDAELHVETTLLIGVSEFKLAKYWVALNIKS